MLTAKRLRELFSYDPETGLFTNRVSRGRAKVGAVAGNRRSDGYIDVRVNYHHYLAHRLAWLWMTGEWPSELIDHKDGDVTNNRWGNLRQCDYSQNQANSKIRKNNSSGYKGVSRYRHRFQAHFRGNYLGTYDTPEAAHAAYCQAVRCLHGEFARIR